MILQVRARGPKESVLRQLVRVRLDDAATLLKGGNPEQRNAAMYLSGYAAECALKAHLCKQTREARLPLRFHRHDLVWLAEQAGASHWSRERRNSLSLVHGAWRVEMRYELRPLDAADVSRFLARVREISKWLLSESGARSFRPSRTPR